MAIAVLTDDEWLRMKKIMGNPEWAEDSKYDTVAGRLQNREELDRQIEAWTSELTAEQVMAMLQGAGVAAGVVANAQDMDEDPQLNYYNFYRQLDHPYMGNLRYYHPAALKLSGAEAAMARPVLVGEHTDQICTEILGMTKTEIEQLRQKGIFE